MPISRDPRNDRRRRVLRDSVEDSAQEPKRRRPRSQDDAQRDESQPRRSAGYSQEVRRACGQRLVQLIPVRPLSFVGVILLSLIVPTLLLVGHYMIYVSGSLQWYGHPLAVSLDASHQSSIAAWFSSHLWLLCLGTTVLTFQLRRHKLDDYDGEYRLWFWLVMTCLIASIDSTTHISELFGLALDRWSQINVGWSGPAVVKATLAVLIGMLGLRLCTELKSVPLSLVFWLVGLVAWAGSAALGQEQLRLEMSLQFRIWLKVALWLGGLTAVWLSALTYLRSVYMEAQRRFLARGRLASTVPLGTRIREGLPSFRRHDSEDGESENGRRMRMPAFLRRGDRAEEEVAPSTRRKSNRAQKQPTRQSDGPETESESRSRWNPFGRRRQNEDEVDSTQEESKPSRRVRSGRDDNAADQDTQSRRGLTGWLRRPKDTDEPDEFKKVGSEERARSKRPSRDDSEDQPTKRSWFSRRNADADSPTETSDSGEKTGWFRRKSANTGPETDAEPKRSWFQRRATADADDSDGEQKKGGFFSRFRLQPPEASDEDQPAEIREVRRTAQLPGTSANDASDGDRDPDTDRPLSKAERKRLRRQQRQQRAA